MAAVEQTIPNLLGGVSQQPDPLKLPGQVKTANNVYLDPTFGALKRPGSELLLQSGVIPEDAKWFPILRDDTEHYLVAMWREGYVSGGNGSPEVPGTLKLKVFDVLNGNQRTVTYDDTEEYFHGDSDYSRISHLTIGDYTFLANPTVQPSTFGINETRPNEALVTIGQAGYGTQYICDFATEDSGQQSRWTVTELQAQNSFAKQNHETPEYSGEITINDWNGTGLAFRLRVEARSFARNEGEDYGHRYTPFVTLLAGGNNTSSFPGEIVVPLSGYNWKIYVTQQRESKTYANLGTAQYTTAVDPSGEYHHS